METIVVNDVYFFPRLLYIFFSSRPFSLTHTHTHTPENKRVSWWLPFRSRVRKRVRHGRRAAVVAPRVRANTMPRADIMEKRSPAVGEKSEKEHAPWYKYRGTERNRKKKTVKKTTTAGTEKERDEDSRGEGKEIKESE